VGLFFAVWIGAVLNWKLRRLDERYGPEGDEQTDTGLQVPR
jgi:hypothetical protein